MPLTSEPNLVCPDCRRRYYSAAEHVAHRCACGAELELDVAATPELAALADFLERGRAAQEAVDRLLER